MHRHVACRPQNLTSTPVLAFSHCVVLIHTLFCNSSPGIARSITRTLQERHSNSAGAPSAHGVPQCSATAAASMRSKRRRSKKQRRSGIHKPGIWLIWTMRTGTLQQCSTCRHRCHVHDTWHMFLSPSSCSSIANSYSRPCLLAVHVSVSGRPLPTAVELSDVSAWHPIATQRARSKRARGPWVCRPELGIVIYCIYSSGAEWHYRAEPLPRVARPLSVARYRGIRTR